MAGTGEAVILGGAALLGLYLWSQNSGSSSQGDGGTLGAQGSDGGGDGTGYTDPGSPPEQLPPVTPPTQDPVRKFLTDPIGGLVAGTLGGVAAFAGASKLGLFDPRAKTPVSEETLLADESPESALKRRTPSEDVFGRPKQVLPNEAPPAPPQSKFEPNRAPLESEVLPSHITSEQAKPRSFATDTSAAVEPGFGGVGRRISSPEARLGAAGAALETVTVLAQVPQAAEAARGLQATGRSNLSASTLATAGVFGGFPASQANIDLARRNPAIAVPILAGEGALGIAKGTLEAFFNPSKFVADTGNALSNLIRPGSGTFGQTAARANVQPTGPVSGQHIRLPGGGSATSGYGGYSTFALNGGGTGIRLPNGSTVLAGYKGYGVF